MNGNHLSLTPRDRQIISEISRFGVMTRHQMMELNLFRSKTRANARLKKLTDAGYLTRRRQPLERGGPRLVYLPGSQLIELRSTRERLSAGSDLFLLHQLGLVDIRLAFERATELIRWLSDKELSSLSLGVLPDAFIEFRCESLTYCGFVEYDRGTETLGRIERKVRGYLDLAFSGRFEKAFQRRFFRVLIITDTVGRRASLSQAVRSLTDRLVRLTTRSELIRQGATASIWQRPGSQQFESLISSHSQPV